MNVPLSKKSIEKIIEFLNGKSLQIERFKIPAIEVDTEEKRKKNLVLTNVFIVSKVEYVPERDRQFRIIGYDVLENKNGYADLYDNQAFDLMLSNTCYSDHKYKYITILD